MEDTTNDLVIRVELSLFTAAKSLIVGGGKGAVLNIVRMFGSDRTTT